MRFYPDYTGTITLFDDISAAFKAQYTNFSGSLLSYPRVLVAIAKSWIDDEDKNDIIFQGSSTDMK